MALFWLKILSIGFPGTVPPEAIYFPFHQALTFGNETKRQLTSMTDCRGSFCCFLNKAKQGKNDALKKCQINPRKHLHKSKHCKIERVQTSFADVFQISWFCKTFLDIELIKFSKVDDGSGSPPAIESFEEFPIFILN